jgi:hypothetical protein
MTHFCHRTQRPVFGAVVLKNPVEAQVRVVFMPEDEYDIDEVFSLNFDPEDAIKQILDGAGDDELEIDEDESEDET